MNRKFIIESVGCFALIVLFQSVTIAQEDLTFGANPWIWNGSVNASVSEVSFKNWTAGGEYSYLLGLNSSMDPQWSDSVWSFVGSWEGEFSVYKRKSEAARKVDDDLELNLKAGYHIEGNLHAVLFADLQSQFWPGYDFYSSPSPTDYISNFMAPGYLTNGLGIDFRSNSLGLSIVFSPAASKETMDFDKGVDPTQYGIQAGRHVHTEFGAYMRITYAKTILPRTSVDLRTILFDNYRKRFGPDLSFKGEIDYSITSFLKLYAKANMLNDDDLNVNIYEDLNGNGQQNDFAGVGPRLQITTQLGVAIGTDF